MSDTNDRLLEVVTMPCPICGLVHGVEKHICTGVISIKGVRVEYPRSTLGAITLIFRMMKIYLNQGRC